MSEEGYTLKHAGDGDMKPRFRFAAKQTAKGAWQFDTTVEVYNEDAVILSKKEDPGDEKKKTLGRQALEIIKDAEKEFANDGKELVSGLTKDDITP